MPAAAIGSCWAPGSWSDTAWESGSWADGESPATSGVPGGVFRRSLPTLARTVRRALPTWSRVWRYRPMPLDTEGDALIAAAGDDRVYAFDLSDAPELAPSTGLTIASGTVLNGAGLTVGAMAVLAQPFDGIPAGKGLACRISGGAAGATYKPACRAVLSDGTKIIVSGRMVKVPDYES